MKELKAILLKPSVKVTMFCIGSVLLGVLPSILISINEWWSILILVVFIVAYIFFSVFYEKQQSNLLKENEKLSEKNVKQAEQITVNNELVQSICALCKSDAENINKVIHDIYIDTDGKVALKEWNFQASCDRICNHIHTHIIKNIVSSEDANNIGVGYVRLIETSRVGKPLGKKQSGKQCELFAYYHPSFESPSVKGVPRTIERKANTYHDAVLFAENKDEIDILLNKEQIESPGGFFFKNGNNHKNYTQYIGIPVFCQTSCNNNKMVGLLEIVCRNNAKIGNTENEIKLIANTIFSVFAYYILVMHKIEKGLLAKPQNQP